MGKKMQSPRLNDSPQVTQLSSAAEPGFDPSTVAAWPSLFIPVLCCPAGTWHSPCSFGSPSFCTCFSPCKTFSTAPLIRPRCARSCSSRARCHSSGRPSLRVRCCMVRHQAIPVCCRRIGDHVCAKGWRVSWYSFVASPGPCSFSGSPLFTPEQRHRRGHC